VLDLTARDDAWVVQSFCCTYKKQAVASTAYRDPDTGSPKRMICPRS